MTNSFFSTRSTRRTIAVAVMAGAFIPVACNEGKLLTAPTPDVVLPKDIASKSALPSAFAAAVGDFQLAYGGGYGGGPPLLDLNEGLAQITGLFSDELLNAETFTSRIEIDRRATTNINTTALQIFQVAQRARATADLVAARYRELDPANPQRAEAQALAGFMYIMFAEDYCNGVPTSHVNDDGSFAYGAPQSGTQLLMTAIAKLDSAIAVASAAGVDGSSALNLARIGKGRALLDLGNFADAAAAVAAVPSTYEYDIQHSETTGRQNNAFYTYNYLESRFTIADREGGNGLPFVTIDDPRASVFRAGDELGDQYVLGFDGSTPLYFTSKYREYKSPIPLAIGAEARLIEAEAAYRAGNPGLMVQKLNQARTEGGVAGLPATLTDPGTKTAREDLLFRERAFWLFGRGYRVGDMRRLVRQYGRAANAVFPTGAWHKGGNYGTDVNFPVPQAEQNNPNVPGGQNACTDRNA